MKILFLIEGIPYPPFFGHKSVAYNLLRQLAKEGHRVTLISVTTEINEEYQSELRKIGIEVIPILYTAKRSLHGYLLSLPRKHNYGILPFTRPSLSRAVESIVTDVMPDVIQAEFFQMACLAANLQFPSVMAFLDSYYFYEKALAKEYKFSIRRLHFELRSMKAQYYERKYYPAFDHCVAITPFDADALRAVGVSTDVTVITSGVDTSYFRPVAKNNETTSLVFLGNMSFIVNELAASRFCRNIFPIILKALPGIVFQIVGHNPTRLVNDLSSPNVVVTGSVPDVRPYLSREAILVAPFAYPGGLKHKVLEAMAMGMAVVGTSAAFSGIEVKDGEHAFVADEPRHFAERVIELAGDPLLKRTLGSNARDLVSSNYTWDRVAKEYEKVYETVINRRDLK